MKKMPHSFVSQPKFAKEAPQLEGYAWGTVAIALWIFISVLAIGVLIGELKRFLYNLKSSK